MRGEGAEMQRRLPRNVVAGNSGQERVDLPSTLILPNEGARLYFFWYLTPESGITSQS